MTVIAFNAIKALKHLTAWCVSMDMVTPIFAPLDIERLANVPPVTLRGWRHRDLLRGFGQEQDNGRWLYSGHEVLSMAIGNELAKAGIDLRYGFWMGWEMGLSVIFVVTGRNESFYRGTCTFWTMKAGNPIEDRSGSELQWKDFGTVSEIEAGANATAAFLINPIALAAQLSDEFKQYMRGNAD